jgi:hypothetical protein
MKVKELIKELIVGPSGCRPQQVHFGLLKGLRFNLDSHFQFQLMYGLYEKEIEKTVRSYTLQAKIAIDIGVSHGIYSLFFATQENIEKAFAFDLSEEYLSLCERNLSLNQASSQKKTVFIRKFVCNEDSPKDGYCTLDLEVGSDYLKPIVIKIDVDGLEMEVLKGASQLLQYGSIALIVETHSSELEEDCIRYLKNKGYQTKIVKNAWWRCVITSPRGESQNRWLIATNSRFDKASY